MAGNTVKVCAARPIWFAGRSHHRVARFDLPEKPEGEVTGHGEAVMKFLSIYVGRSGQFLQRSHPDCSPTG